MLEREGFRAHKTQIRERRTLRNQIQFEGYREPGGPQIDSQMETRHDQGYR